MSDAYVVGLQRTGTNYLQVLLEKKFSCNVVNNFFKHAYASEYLDSFSEKTISDEVRETGLPCVVAVKNPVLWLESIVKRSPRDLDERRSNEIGLISDKDQAYASIYRKFYSSWADMQDASACKIFRYEDILKGNYQLLADYVGVSEISADIKEGEAFNIGVIPMSISFSEEDRNKYAHQKTSISKHRAQRFMNLVGKDLVEYLGYYENGIIYSEPSEWEKSRDFVYNFTSGSSVISDYDVASNLARLPSALADDHTLLIAWAKWLQGRGEYVEAMKKYILASEKIGLMVERFPDQGFLEISRAECMRAIQEMAGRESKKSIDSGRATMLRCASGSNKISGLDFSLSLFALHEGEIEKSLDFAKKAIKKEPKYAWMRHHAGSLLYRMKRYTESEAEFKQAVNLEPKKAEHLFALSESLIAQGKYQEARSFALRAASEKSEFSWYWQHAGYISFQLGNIEEAIRLYKISLMVDPGKADFWYQLSEGYRKNEQNRNSLLAGLNTVHLEPGHDWYHHHVGHLFKQNKDWKNSEIHFKRAADLSPTKAEHWFALSEARRSDGKLPEATEAAQVALRVQPNHPWYAHHLGALLRECKRFEESVAAYSNAIQLEPSNSTHWFGMSETLRLASQLTEAVSAARHAFEIDPQHVWYGKHYRAMAKEMTISS